jgi:hypothetical protein
VWGGSEERARLPHRGRESGARGKRQEAGRQAGKTSREYFLRLACSCPPLLLPASKEGRPGQQQHSAGSRPAAIAQLPPFALRCRCPHVFPRAVEKRTVTMVMICDRPTSPIFGTYGTSGMSHQAARHARTTTVKPPFFLTFVVQITPLFGIALVFAPQLLDFRTRRERELLLHFCPACWCWCPGLARLLVLLELDLDWTCTFWVIVLIIIFSYRGSSSSTSSARESSNSKSSVNSRTVPQLASTSFVLLASTLKDL